jgi:hypothetical protein
MTGNRWTLTLLALAFATMAGALPSEAAEYRCRNGDVVRRIEVRGTDAPQNTSCEVRYWRNAATSGSGQSLWRSDSDPDYCAARARDLVARLQSGGWRCASSEPATQAGGEGDGAAAREETAPADVSVQLTLAPEVGARDVATSAEALAPAVAPAAPPAMRAALPSPAVAHAAPPAMPAALPSPAVAHAAPPAMRAAPASPAVGQTAPYPPLAAPPSPDVASTTPSAAPGTPPPPPVIEHAARAQSDHPSPATPGHPNAALLDRVVEQTLSSVQELYGGRFEADPAAFGDLDRDGVADAAVLVTYQAERDEHVQYLVAYLFDGETFRSVATKNVGGRFLDAVRADLQGIVDGRILVELEALDADARCCARHRTAFALDNGQLVQVADPDAAALERTSRTERLAPG